MNSSAPARLTIRALRAAVEPHQPCFAHCDVLEMTADTSRAQRSRFHIGKAPADRFGPERVAFGRPDRVGGDGDGRHQPSLTRDQPRGKGRQGSNWQAGSRPAYGRGVMLPEKQLSGPAMANSIPHPLDPLSEAEVTLASDILRTTKDLGETVRFTHVQLEEPAKAEVLGWKPGTKLARRAAATLFDCKTGATHLATVDLHTKTVTAWREHPTRAHPFGQPPVTIEEVFKVGDIVKRDSGWRRAMTRRGLSDAEIELVQVDPFSAGYFDREVEKGRRLVSAVSYWRKDAKDNGYAHPIEGVVALVDLIEEKVVHLVDEPDIVPIPKRSRNYDTASIGRMRDDVKPLDIVQKDGPSFSVEGWKVAWQNFSFRVGWTAREGLVLHGIAFRSADHLSRQRHRHDRPLCRSDSEPLLEERLRCR
jgi:Cu2+-containing amine oxidase